MNKEIKKGFEHYKGLTKKQQKQFRLNCHRNGVKRLQYLLNDTIDREFFIQVAFSWAGTKQGHYYWKNIATNGK